MQLSVKVALLATVIIPAIALIVKCCDRYFTQYKIKVVQPVPQQKAVCPKPPTLVHENEPAGSTAVTKVVDAEQQSGIPETTTSEVARQSSPRVSPRPPSKEPPSDTSSLPAQVNANEQTGVTETTSETPDEQESSASSQPATADNSVGDASKTASAAPAIDVAAEKRKKDEEYNDICKKVADAVFPQLLEMCYTTDGHLNGELRAHKCYHGFWGMQKERYPEALREKAFQAECFNWDLAEAQKLNDEADANEKERDDAIQNLPKTLFPLQKNDECYPCASETDLAPVCALKLSDHDLFIGVTDEEAIQIEQSCFNFQRPINDQMLLSGYGTSFVSNAEDAHTAHKKWGVVFKAKLKAGVKIAEYNDKVNEFITYHLRQMAEMFGTKKEGDILQQLNNAGLQATKQNSRLESQEVISHLKDLIVRNFYERQGFRGVYHKVVYMSGKARVINLYHPAEDIAKFERT